MADTLSGLGTSPRQQRGAGQIKIKRSGMRVARPRTRMGRIAKPRRVRARKASMAGLRSGIRSGMRRL
jgi:hypothetical protein